MAGSYITIKYDPTDNPWNTIDFKITVASGYNVYYKTTKMQSWSRLSNGTTGIYLFGKPGTSYYNTYGDRIMLKGIGNSAITSGTNPIVKIIEQHGNIWVGGDLESLVEGEGSTAATVTIPPYAFSYMFGQKASNSDTTCVTDCSELIFPNTLSSHCCSYMFYNNKMLKDRICNLPNMTLSEYCYESMFENNTVLTTLPELPATTLAPGCYKNMFKGCPKITTPIELPALNLPSNCYEGMFRNCKGINMSDVKGPNYIIPYRIPAAGTGTNPSGNATTYMFTDISPDTAWQGTPNINQTYYLYQETPELNAIFVGVDGKAKRVNKMFIGVKGQAQRVRNLKIGYKGHAVELR